MGKSLREGIEEQLQRLLGIKVRLHFLRALEGDLESVTRKKPFRVWDGFLWMAVSDIYNRLVIDLASFAKGLHKHHLKTIAYPWLKHLRSKRRRDDQPKYPELAKIYEQGHAEAFARLFPSINPMKRAPGKDDVKVLRANIEARVDRLRNDRNWNRAHAFELPGKADWLDLKEIDGLFVYLEQVLNDMLLCATGVTWSMHSPYTEMPPDRSATTLVDHVLLDRVVHPLENRTKIYADLHERHSARGGSGFFNDRDGDGLHPPDPSPLRDLAQLEEEASR